MENLDLCILAENKCLCYFNWHSASAGAQSRTSYAYFHQKKIGAK